MSRPELPPLPDDIVDRLNAMLGGFDRMIGFRFTRATHDELAAEVPITPALHQPHGLVHGGVYATIIETLASTAAYVNGMHHRLRIVGLDNSTSFLRATRAGLLRGVATPRFRGRRTQVWEVTVVNDSGKVAASGRVRVLALQPDAEVAGDLLHMMGQD